MGDWSHFSDLTVDPVDDCTFWYTNEYYPATSGAGSGPLVAISAAGQFVTVDVSAQVKSWITNPATNLMLQGRLDGQPKRRGITRVGELLERGVNVSFGQDCVRDTFYPFGRNDPLEVALIVARRATVQ